MGSRIIRDIGSRSPSCPSLICESTYWLPSRVRIIWPICIYTLRLAFEGQISDGKQISVLLRRDLVFLQDFAQWAPGRAGGKPSPGAVPAAHLKGVSRDRESKGCALLGFLEFL